MPLPRPLTSTLAASIVVCLVGCGAKPDHGATLVAPDSMGGSVALGGKSSSIGSGGNTASGAVTGTGGAGEGKGGAPSAGAPNAGSPNSQGGAASAGASGDPTAGAPNGGSAGSDGEVPQSLCNPGASWALMTRVPGSSTPNFARFGGISGDELTIAWSAPNGDAFVATRGSRESEFGAPKQVNSIALAADRVALSPTGAYLVGVSSDRKNLLSFELSSDGWKAGDGPEFGMLRMSSESDATLSDPVLGSDKRSLYFVRTIANLSSIYTSTWDALARAWGAPVSLSNAELTAAAGHAMRPTGASRDGRTLFFFDESTRTERAAFRPDVDAAFDVFTTLGSFVGAMSNLGCTTLYYEDRDATGEGVFIAR